MKTIPVCVLSIGLCFPAVHGYENTKAHPEINKAIVTHAEKYLADKLPANHTWRITGDKTKYAGTAVIDYGFSVNTYEEGERSLTGFEWVAHGGISADEPELAAAIRHFYDPTGHSGGRKYLTNRGTCWEGVYANPEIDAIEWALGDTPKGEDNNWSLSKGKEHLIDAFQSYDDGERKELLAKAFRCLGEVLHNTADMGCPPHVRNDSHAAPIGNSWYSVIGSPDPYEEIFSPEWATDYNVWIPDPALKSFCENATSIRGIHEKLAEFTNRNFFTRETINGVGNDDYSPMNADGDYPQPLMQNLDKDLNEDKQYTYTRVFPSGNKVKMCKEQSRLRSSFWSYPFIDPECVESQASELVPNILCAGANVIRLFLPEFQIKILEASPDDEVKGQVTHLPNAEYDEAIYYRGPVELIDAKTMRPLAELDCLYGEFQGKVDGIDENDRLIARIRFGGLTVQSPAFEVKGSTDTGIQNVTVWIYANMPTDSENERVALNITNLKASDELTTVPLVWTGTSFSVRYQYSFLPTGGELRATLRGNITGEMSEDFKKLISLEGEEICQYPESDGAVMTVTERVELANVELTVMGNASYANFSGVSWRQNLVSIYYSAVKSDDPKLTYTSDTIDWSASTPASLNIIMNLKEE